ncbi:MAG: hypothetical protein ACI86H_000146 [bacterium]|jgi:hypothetical protein
MRYKLVTKASLNLILILSGCLFLIFYLNYAKYKKTYKTLMEENITTVGLEMKGLVEDGVNRGLSLQIMQAVQSTLSQIEQKYTEVSGVIIFDHKGVVQFSTQKKSLLKVPPQWLLEKTNKKKYWKIITSSGYIIGFPIKRNHHDVIGGIVIAHQVKNILEHTFKLNEFRIYLPLIWIGFIGIGIIGITVCFYFLGLHYPELQKILDHKQNARQTKSSIFPSYLEHHVERFRDQISEVSTKLDGAEKILIRKKNIFDERSFYKEK